MPAELKRFLLIYSSQTGQAKAIAEEIAEKAPAEGFHAELHCISQTEKRFWLDREQHAVIITSTTGDGDPPDTAHKFWRRLKKNTLERTHYSQLRYSLMGLGDSNYSNFCNCGKNFDKRLKELGAVPFLSSRWADDAVGLEQEVEPWMEDLFPALRKELFTNPGLEETNQASDDHLVDGGQQEGQQKVTVDPQPANRTVEPDLITEKVKIDRTQTEVEADKSSSVLSSTPQSVDTTAETQDSPTKSTPQSVDTTAETQDSPTKSTPQSVDTTAETKDSTTKSTPESVTTAETQDSPAKSTPQSVDSTADTQHSPTKSTPESVTTAETQDSPAKSTPQSVDTTAEKQHSPTKSENHSDESMSKTIDNGAGKLEQVVETLVNSVALLSESGLTLPVLPAQYLKLTYQPDAQLPDLHAEMQNGCPFPSTKSDVVTAHVTRAVQMTSGDAVKKALKVSINLQDADWDWAPGDSVGVLCSNDTTEVDAITKRLAVEADTPYHLEVIPGTKKRAAAVPPHIPPTGTLRDTLAHCCDIRSPPKKALLRSLVECCTSDSEKRRLQELCSKQGAASYTSCIREPNLSILDILTAFPSCSPPVERLLEHLPRLQPRPYSAASSPVLNARQIDMVFNVVDIPAGRGRSERRLGVCTGLLDRITADIQTKLTKDSNKEQSQHSLSGQLGQLSLEDAPLVGSCIEGNSEVLKLIDRLLDWLKKKVRIYLRNNQHFRPPSCLKHPVLMIGPGTGVAPFIGFLQQREKALAEKQDGDEVGECWLFFGCRHKERDFLFRKELEEFEQNGALSKLCVCFSRDAAETTEETGAYTNTTVSTDSTVCTERPRYVQHLIRQHAAELVRLITESEAIVYVCGDARGMARDVSETFTKLLQTKKGWTEKEAMEYMKQLRLSQRYKEDVWT